MKIRSQVVEHVYDSVQAAQLGTGQISKTNVGFSLESSSAAASLHIDIGPEYMHH